ncbi:unnamed protein product, partial [Mesorhabditis spiculigera]
MLLFNLVVLLLFIPALLLAQDGAPVDYSERMDTGEPESSHPPTNATTSNSTMGFNATTKAATVMHEKPTPTADALPAHSEGQKRKDRVPIEPYGAAWVAHVLQIWAVSTLPTIIFCVWRLIARIRDPERQRPMPKQSHLLK